ncbi:UNVERIFIED_CONTAM: hypothetical protein Sangu_2193400 [Sesamum angustifolium]|uniref:DNA-directed RNA polymerase III subunit RPC3 n=1 Tax=Sesamum angustifolium TaxID=2727405 RepID=A0AAW2LFH5_9LAMI
MVSLHGVQLATHLISSFYGDLCSKVCECLLRRGTLTLAQIIRFTELSRENVINCLRVLIHQNCVQAFAIQQEGAFGEAPRIITQYMALFDNMIHKMRAPKFMQIVSEELGKDCLGIFQGLIQHGRLSINQIIDRNEQTADIKGIIESAQTEEVESVVLRRYGREAYRIFRLLSKAGRFLESDKISDTTFVEKKDTIKILYKLWKDDYLHMEKVMTSGAKQSLFLLWRVNKEPLREHVLDEMYHAALNLRLRIAHEQDKGKEILQLPREKLVGELEKRYKLLGKVRVILESSLMNLDEAIMLFHDF